MMRDALIVFESSFVLLNLIESLHSGSARASDLILNLTIESWVAFRLRLVSFLETWIGWLLKHLINYALCIIRRLKLRALLHFCLRLGYLG